MPNLVNFDLGTTPDGNWILKLKETLVSCGWILKGSGDGTSNFSNIATNDGSSATDHITSTTIANTNRAWFRLRSPAIVADGFFRELVFQYAPTGTAKVNLRIKYSLCPSNVGFEGGSPSATQVPTATDQTVVVGTGTDASPTGDRIAYPNNYALLNIVCEQVSPFSFYVYGYDQGSLAKPFTFAYEALKANTYPISDADPYVFVVTVFNDFSTEAGSVVRGLFHYLGSKVMMNFTSAIAPATGVNNANNYDDLIPVSYYRLESDPAPNGFKGYARNILATTALNIRQTTDTYSVNVTRDRILIKNSFSSIYPWEPGVIPAS